MATCSETKELFLEACQAQESQPFLDFLEKHKPKSDDFSICDLLLGLSKKQHDKLWAGLFELCAKTLAKLNTAADPVEQVTVEDVLQCLQGIVTVGVSCLESKQRVTADKMFDTLTILHGVLLDLPDSASKLQYNIAKLCHSWWRADLPDRELLVPNTIMYFLVKTLQPSGTVKDMKLIYSMRESFSQIHLEDESSASLKELLEQCIINPTYLKADEGRKFLSFLFGLDGGLVERLHAAVKNQLPSCPKTMTCYYGEVYFKAWRNSPPHVTAKIETHCIQDLMHCAIHASRTGTRNLSFTLRQLLSYFTKQKRQQGVDKMLLELYEPILWRAFKVANASVRANAAALLIDAFPLQNPEANKEYTDALLQRQIDILQGFLDDKCPVVRVTGVQGVCRILGMFWELIPPHVLTDFMTKLVTSMAFDLSSSDVRVAVIKGLMFVVDNPLSHPILKTLLPALKDFIHDTTEKVIVAFIDFLLKVKGLKTIKVWSIVPVEDLLARLEMDSPPVARRLVSLLFKSFQPNDRDPSVQIERVMALIEMNPRAMRVFYQYAHKHMSVATCADFMMLLCRCVKGCINQHQHYSSLLMESGESMLEGEGSTGGGAKDQDQAESRQEEEEEEEEGLSLKDTDVIDGMLEIIAILWTGIAQQLAKPVNQAVMQKLTARFGKDVPKFLATFQDGRSLSAVLILASFLPASSIPAFSHSCLSKLKSLSPSAAPDAYGPLLQCLVSWGRGNSVITLISDWLEATLKRSNDSADDEEEEEADQSKRKKKVTFSEPVKPQPLLALAYLDWLLANYSCRTVLLESSARTMEDLVTSLRGVMPCLERRLVNPGPLSDVVSDEVLVCIMQAYCRVTIHVHSKRNAEPSTPPATGTHGVSGAFDELLAWCDRELLPVLPQSSGEVKSEGSASEESVLQLAKDCLVVVLKMACDVVMLGFVCGGFQSHLANFCHLVLLSDCRLEFVPVVAKVMCQLGRGRSAVDIGHQDVVTDLFTKFIKAVGSSSGSEEKQAPQLQQTLSSIKPAITDLLKHTHQTNDQLQDNALASTMAACVGEMTGVVAKSEGTLDPAHSPAALPTLTGFLVAVVISNQSLLRSFVYELEHCVSVGAMQTHSTLLAALHILHPLGLDKKRGAGCGIKECLTTIQQQMQKLKGDEMEEGEEDNPNDPNRFMLEQMESLEKQITQAIGGVA